jgi:thioesterase domain-containing protein
MKWDAASVDDDFFESGGNSLSAVALIHDINKHFGIRLPFQAIFTAPTIEKLAQLIDGEGNVAVSRLVRLQGKDTQRPVFCWPGLGGYPMNLKVLADSLALDRPFYGVQAVGINEGEAILPNIAEMAAEDIKAIKQRWPSGPYSVWGYSFGARVAFEVAAQLERAGDRVDRVVLIAPGSPIVEAGPAGTDAIDPAYADHAFVTILFSVFGGGISGPVLKECLKVAKDDESFVSFISSRYPHLDKALVRRITSIVHQTYEFKYTFRELMERQLNAPIVIFKAKGDDYSFVENHGNRFKRPPTVVSLDVDHYGLLKEPGVATLVNAIDRLQLASEQAAEAPVHLLMTN